MADRVATGVFLTTPLAGENASAGFINAMDYGVPNPYSGAATGVQVSDHACYVQVAVTKSVLAATLLLYDTIDGSGTAKWSMVVTALIEGVMSPWLYFPNALSYTSTGTDFRFNLVVRG